MRMTGTIRAVFGVAYLIALLTGESLGTAGERKNLEPARDFLGDPLPAGSIARLGSTRLWHAQVKAITFSADGKELATLGVRPDATDSVISTIRWWDAANGRLLRELCFPNHPLDAWAASPDGKQLALGVDDLNGTRRIALWDVAKGKEIDGPLMKHIWWVTFLRYLPDGKTLVSRDATDRSFHFWDLATRKEVKRVLPVLPRGKYRTLNASALSRDGKRSAWYVKTYEKNANGGHGLVDGELIQVVEDGGKILFEQKGRFKANVQVAISPDGKLFAHTSDHHAPQIIDIASRKTLAVFPLKYGYSQALAFSPDSKTLACKMFEYGGKIRVKLWDVETHRELCSLLASHDSHQWNAPLAFTTDGKTVAVGADGLTKIYDVATGKERVKVPVHHHFPVSELFFSSDGNSLLSSDKAVVYRWTTNKNAPLGFRSPPLVRHRADASDFLKANNLLSGMDTGVYSLDLTRALNKSLDVFDISQPRPRKVCRLLVERGKSYWTHSFSPDKQVVVLCRHEGEEMEMKSYEVFDSANGKRLSCWPSSEEVNSTFSLDSQIFAWQEREQGQIILGNVRSGKIIKTLTTDLSRKPERPWPVSYGSTSVGDSVRCRWGFDCLVLSPDNQRVAAAWNSNLSALATWGQTLAVSEEKEPTTLYVWNVATGKEMARIPFKAPKDKMPQVTCLAFLHDGRTLAAGYLNDADVHLIEIASGRERAVLRGHQGTVRSLVLSPEGHHLISGSDDTTILVWDLDQLPSASSPPEKTQLSVKQRTRLWEDLASTDAVAAFRAIETLRRHPEQAIALLEKRLQPIAEVKPQRIQHWIADLDSGEFAVRDRATKELERLEEQAELALRKALATPPSLEVRLRLQRLLETVTAFTLSPERMRQVRGVEVLEALGSPAARTHLEKLASGAAAARLTFEAKESLQRLTVAR